MSFRKRAEKRQKRRDCRFMRRANNNQPRYAGYFDRIISPMFSQDINNLMSYNYDIRDILMSNAISDVSTQVNDMFISTIGSYEVTNARQEGDRIMIDVNVTIPQPIPYINVQFTIADSGVSEGPTGLNRGGDAFPSTDGGQQA